MYFVWYVLLCCAGVVIVGLNADGLMLSFSAFVVLVLLRLFGGFCVDSLRGRLRVFSHLLCYSGCTLGRLLRG